MSWIDSMREWSPIEVSALLLESAVAPGHDDACQAAQRPGRHELLCSHREAGSKQQCTEHERHHDSNEGDHDDLRTGRTERRADAARKSKSAVKSGEGLTAR